VAWRGKDRGRDTVKKWTKGTFFVRPATLQWRSFFPAKIEGGNLEKIEKIEKMGDFMVVR
jgi:hypothetical protein